MIYLVILTVSTRVYTNFYFYFSDFIKGFLFEIFALQLYSIFYLLTVCVRFLTVRLHTSIPVGIFDFWQTTTIGRKSVRYKIFKNIQGRRSTTFILPIRTVIKVEPKTIYIMACYGSSILYYFNWILEGNNLNR